MENHGEQIKKVGTAIFVIGIIGGIASFIGGVSYGGAGILGGIIACAGVIIAAWIQSIFLKGFGELIEATGQIRDVIYEEYKHTIKVDGVSEEEVKARLYRIDLALKKDPLSEEDVNSLKELAKTASNTDFSNAMIQAIRNAMDNSRLK